MLDRKPFSTHSKDELMGSLANSIKKLGYEFEWIREPSDFDRAEVSQLNLALICRLTGRNSYSQA